jgi:hypothetical protein
VFRSPRVWMADQNGWTFTGGLFFPWAWTRRCNIERAVSCSRHWLGATAIIIAPKIPTVCVQISQTDRNRWTSTGGLFSWWTWTRRYNIIAGPILPQTWAWRYNNSTKNSYCFCSDLPGPGWLAGMGGRSPLVHLPRRHGLGAATLQRATSCRRHWLCATKIKTALKFLPVCVQISQGLNDIPEWVDVHRRFIFPGGIDEALQHYSRPLLAANLGLALQHNNCNKNS